MSPSVRRPVYRRAWFWVVVVVLLVVVGGAVAVLQLVRSAVPPDLVLVDSTDFSTQPDQPLESSDGLSSELVGGRFMIRALEPGPMYANMSHVAPTDAIKVEASMAWPATTQDTQGDVYSGLLVLNDQGEGYAWVCGTDGTVSLWNVGVEQTTPYAGDMNAASDKNPDCTGDFTLSMEVIGSGGLGSDLISTEPGEVGWVPGTSEGPFTHAGFVTFLEDESQTPPGVDVLMYQLWVAE